MDPSIVADRAPGNKLPGAKGEPVSRQQLLASSSPASVARA